VKSSNEDKHDKHWQSPSGSRVRPPFPNPASPTVAPREGALKADKTPSRPAWRPGNRISLEGSSKML
jgi:hypothetical protein